MKKCFIIIAWFLQIQLIDVFALRDMHIRVPEAVRVGDTVTLACDYDLEQVALYTIKWYRDDVEFYRYVPKESPPSREFIVEHLNVDVSRSNSREVTLTNVERETSGEFKCEVSADAPLFHTEIRAAHLLVADIPDDGPILTTQSQKVAPGAKIKANCTSPPAHPPVNITWFVNDVEVEKKFGIHIQRALARYNNAIPQLETVHSIIAITAVPDIFKSGKLKLRCLATMFTLYRRTEELEVQEDAPLLALIMIPTTPSSQGTCNGIYDATKYLIYTMAAIMLLKSMNLIKS